MRVTYMLCGDWCTYGFVVCKLAVKPGSPFFNLLTAILHFLGKNCNHAFLIYGTSHMITSLKYRHTQIVVRKT